MPGLAVQILPAAFRVTPGGTAALSIEVRNLSQVVDRYTCEVVGVDPGWWTVSPPSIELLPDASGGGPADAPSRGRFTVTLHPPRRPEARAGEWPIGVKVTAEHTGERAVEESTIVIEPFGSIEAQLRPAVISGRLRATAALLIANEGNRPEHVELRATDPEDRLALEFDALSLDIAPGERARARLWIRPADGNLLGATRVRPFQLEARPRSDTADISLAGTFRHRSVLPGWLPPVAAVLVALGLAGLATWRLIGAPTPTEPNANGVVAIATPATPTLAAPTATPASTPTPPPTETPTTKPIQSPAPTPRHRLHANEALLAGDQLFSPNGKFSLIMQGDGNLVLYKVATGCPLWASNTANTDPAMGRAYLRDDGNLAIQTIDGATTLWISDVGSVQPVNGYVAVLNGGAWAIFDNAGNDYWSSDDYGQSTCP